MRSITHWLLILAVNVLVGLHATQAQEAPTDCAALYDQFLSERVGPEISTMKKGKKYLDRCRTEEGQEKARVFVSNQVPRLEEKILSQSLWSALTPPARKTTAAR